MSIYHTVMSKPPLRLKWPTYETLSANHLDSNGPLMRLSQTEHTIPELTQSPQLSQLLFETVKRFIVGLHSRSNHNEWLGIRLHNRAWFRVPSQCWCASSLTLSVLLPVAGDSKYPVTSSVQACLFAPCMVFGCSGRQIKFFCFFGFAFSAIFEATTFSQESEDFYH